MRSDQVGYAPQLGVLLRELEDKIDVARIQQQVWAETLIDILFTVKVKPRT
jgi:hypothetical protein